MFTTGGCKNAHHKFKFSISELIIEVSGADEHFERLFQKKCKEHYQVRNFLPFNVADELPGKAPAQRSFQDSSCKEVQTRKKRLRAL